MALGKTRDGSVTSIHRCVKWRLQPLQDGVLTLWSPFLPVESTSSPAIGTGKMVQGNTQAARFIHRRPASSIVPCVSRAR